MRFDDKGNLVGGILKDVTLTILYDNLVLPFSSSETRERNYQSFVTFLREFNDQQLLNVTKIWFDGSFCTKKENPNDIDMIIFLKMDQINLELFSFLKESHDIIRLKHLDVYVCWDKETINDSDFESQAELLKTYSTIDYQEKYWMGQFGFDRNQNHKAIVELNMEGGIRDELRNLLHETEHQTTE